MQVLHTVGVQNKPSINFVFLALLLNHHIKRARQIVETYFGNTFHPSFLANPFMVNLFLLL